MQSETVIIMIVGLVAIGLIRLVIAMVGREFAADHPHVKSRSDSDSAGSSKDETEGAAADLAVPSQRPVRGTGKKSHLYEFPTADANAPVENESTDIKSHPAAS